MKSLKHISKSLPKVFFGLILLAWGTAFITGCDDCDDCYIVGEDTPPAVPRGLFSETGNNSVTLWWIENQDEETDFYVIYRSLSEFGRYDWLGEADAPPFVDNSADNGDVYYYAITAVGFNGLESDLSYETVYDVPRPDGFNVWVYDYFTNSLQSAFDFSTGSVLHGDDVEADVWFDFAVIDNVFGDPTPTLFINAADDMTDLQDYGYTGSIDDVGWAPDDGWSTIGYEELILGHTYIIWTWDNHYAKLRVTSLDYDNRRVRFDWAYQPWNYDPQADDYEFHRDLKVIPDELLPEKPKKDRPEGYGKRIPK
ncbi:MAG TPA: hypothetical protein ENO22_01635 [candidate division Zixibacteria bacterium]|nr:hypothetical protein [candidate division Zixibacteria bacterium]